MTTATQITKCEIKQGFNDLSAKLRAAGHREGAANAELFAVWFGGTDDERKVIADVVYAHAITVNDDWTPAAGGTEEPFVTRLGVRVQYMWQPSTGAHAYLNLDTDMIMTDAQAAFAGV